MRLTIITKPKHSWIFWNLCFLVFELNVLNVGAGLAGVVVWVQVWLWTFFCMSHLSLSLFIVSCYCHIQHGIGFKCCQSELNGIFHRALILVVVCETFWVPKSFKSRSTCGNVPRRHFASHPADFFSSDRKWQFSRNLREPAWTRGSTCKLFLEVPRI